MITIKLILRCYKISILIVVLSCIELYAQTNFPSFGIIHNSLTNADQKIMLGVNPFGNLNTPTQSDKNILTLLKNSNSLNVSVDSGNDSLDHVNKGSVGISYYWLGGADRRDSNGNYVYSGSGKNKVKNKYIAGWYDSTSQGNKWEAWGAGAIDDRGNQSWASISAHVGLKSSPASISNQPKMVVKNFTVDKTSIKSTVWIYDSSDLPMLEVTHLYGPTQGLTNKTLFQGLVTITNISGSTLKDVRYRRTMDWDVLENVSSPTVAAIGIENSFNSLTLPKVWSYCDNGGEDNSAANPYSECSAWNQLSKNLDYLPPNGLNAQLGSAGTGSSFDFQFGDLNCNESATFYVYYGAGNSYTETANNDYTEGSVPDAMKRVGASIYSMGFDPKYTDLVYTFGFKGVSGSAVPPNLPTKIASLPAGSSTIPTNPQTYSAPVLGNGNIYQALFYYQNDKQWIGDVVGYKLDSNGDVLTSTKFSASKKLLQLGNISADHNSGGRSIWTVGKDPLCMQTSLPITANPYNNFTIDNSEYLEKLLFNCSSQTDSNTTNNLIKFVRGYDTYLEDGFTDTNSRISILGDTYHSELVFVGPPRERWVPDKNQTVQNEVAYRNTKGYSAFATANKDRIPVIFAGSNDGMLHAFDQDLNELWAFIPPSVLPILRNMIGTTGSQSVNGSTPKNGTTNSIFTVDGPIAVKDVYINDAWKTILIGGLGWGGNSYYALDITNPINPYHLFTINNDVPNKSINYWDSSGLKLTVPYDKDCDKFNYSKLGGAWSRPAIMLLPNQRWVAVFGGGYSGGASVTGTGTQSSFGGNVYVIDLESDGSSTSGCVQSGKEGSVSTGGHVLKSIVIPDDPSSNIPNGVTAHLSVVTADGTSLATYTGGIAYFTDLQGKLWKFNLSDSPGDTLYSLYQNFNAKGTLANDRMGFNQVGTTIVTSGTEKKLFNYYGTGDLTRLQRRVPINNSIDNMVYGIVDDSFPKMTNSSSPPVTGLINRLNPQCDLKSSWYGNVGDITGVERSKNFQKIVGRAAVFNKYVYFTSYQPQDTSCPKYGQSRLIEIADVCKSTGAGADIGPGLATSPTIDSRGNIYFGVSNLVPGTDMSKYKNITDNISKIKATPSGTNFKVNFKSWREIRAR